MSCEPFWGKQESLKDLAGEGLHQIFGLENPTWHMTAVAVIHEADNLELGGDSVDGKTWVDFEEVSLSEYVGARKKEKGRHLDHQLARAALWTKGRG